MHTVVSFLKKTLLTNVFFYSYSHFMLSTFFFPWNSGTKNDPQASQSYQPIEFLILSLLVLWLLFCNGQYLETESHCVAQAGSLRHSCLCLLSPGVCHQDYWIFISPTKSQANSSPQRPRCVVSQWSKTCVPWQVW